LGGVGHRPPAPGLQKKYAAGGVKPGGQRSVRFLFGLRAAFKPLLRCVESRTRVSAPAFIALP
jgi:hypothetical protein